MLLCLVYHKVVALPDRRIYEVSARMLQEHIKLLLQSGIDFVRLDCIDRTPSESRVSVMLTFDDATVDHAYLVDEILGTNGISAVFFVPTAKLGAPGRLSMSDLRRLAEHGNVIGSHGHTHERMDKLPPEQLAYELDVSSQIIADCVGKRPTFFAPPGGFINARVYEHAFERGFRYVRTMRWGYNRDVASGTINVLPMDIFLSASFLRWGIGHRNEWLVTALYQVKEQMKRGASGKMWRRFQEFISLLTS